MLKRCPSAALYRRRWKTEQFQNLESTCGFSNIPLSSRSKNNKFFVSMAVTIGKNKLMQAHWGVTFKIGSGALLSIANVATDLYAIFTFLHLGLAGFANASIAIILLCMGVNLALVYVQRKKRGLRILIEESLIVISHLKPAIAASRVVSGGK